MPKIFAPKSCPHPWEAVKKHDRAYPRSFQSQRAGDDASVPLQVTTNFTFLTGASHPEEMVQQAAQLGCAAVAITDTNTLAGMVRAHMAAKEADIQLIIGCRLELDWPTRTSSCFASEPSSLQSRCAEDTAPLSLLAYPTDRASYGRLCRLLTLGRRRAPKGQCYLTLHDLIEHHEGLLAVLVPSQMLDQDLINVASGLADVFDDDRFSIAASFTYGHNDHMRLAQIAAITEHLKVPMVATNNVHYHRPQRRALQDVLTCIRLGCTLEEAGLNLMPNAEYHLKPAAEMARLFSRHRRALARTVEIANRTSGFSLDQLKYQYPQETCPRGKAVMKHLIDLTWQGARDRYPRGVPQKVRQQIEHEFRLINELNYAPYFLTVHDLVHYAQSRGILCQGRGAAANSAVCYCLGVTSVDPDRIDVLFERFVSAERNEPPDIDIDFEHERREEVIQYIYRKYGRDHAALTAEVITYRGRSAVRQVGKALGFSLDSIDRLAKNMDWWAPQELHADRLRELGLNPGDPTVRRLTWLVGEILGFPKCLSQHVGGFVITRTPLCELVPIENAAMEDRTVIEWDKNDINALGILKVDILGLGMLTCVNKCFKLIGIRCSGTDGEDRGGLDLNAIDFKEDPSVYDMICQADTVGVFQIESRAQMSMLPRLKPRCFYDLVIQVAIVRPGPIQGDMVHPYLRRRNGEELVSYPNKIIKRVLGKTLGVPLFQEQAMQLAVVAAGFTPGETDQLRRAIAACRSKKKIIDTFGKKIIQGMLANGYAHEFAQRCFGQIKGFSEYGFPESHAASFALIVYVSAWLKKHHPAAFATALINSQPMGFYAPAQIVRDATEHGVQVFPVDANDSVWDCVLVESDKGQSPALRLGMRLVKGLKEQDANAIIEAVRRYGRFDSIEWLWRESGVCVSSLRCLATADAFGSMGLNRRTALWQVRALRDNNTPLFEAAIYKDVPMKPGQIQAQRGKGQVSVEGAALLPPMSTAQQVQYDYATVGLSLKSHPIWFIRRKLVSLGATACGALGDKSCWPNGLPISVAGLVLVRQRPATASGIVFMTLEDESGTANLIVRPQIFLRYQKAVCHSMAVLARGKVERQGQVVHVMVHCFLDLSDAIADLDTSSRDFH